MLLHCAMVCCATPVGGLDGAGNGENEIRHKFMMPVFHRHKSHGAFQFQFGGAGHLETSANHFLLLGQHHRISRKRKIMPDEYGQEKQQLINLNLTSTTDTDCTETKTTVQNAIETRNENIRAEDGKIANMLPQSSPSNNTSGTNAAVCSDDKPSQNSPVDNKPRRKKMQHSARKSAGRSSIDESTSSKCSSSTDTKSSRIPLCMVCGAIASGVHYLVWTCNCCKTFFRRAVMENRRYSCKRSGNCTIDERSRCGCRHCRFQKCLRVGMKFTEINIDRKRRITRGRSSTPEKEQPAQQELDPTLRDLLKKEAQFRVLLCSQLTTVYGTFGEAMEEGKCVFVENFEEIALDEHKCNRIQQNESQMSFYDWRARILSIAIQWIKAFPIFSEFPKSDKEALIVHSAFAILTFSEAFHTPERYSDRLVYPDGLQVTRNIAHGNIGFCRAMVAVINDILSVIRRVQMTEVEYVFIQALLLFDPDCLSISDQSMPLVVQERESLLESMRKYLIEKAANKGDRFEAATRMAQLLMCIPKIQKVANFKREFICANEEQRIKERNPAAMVESELVVKLAKLYATTSFF